MGCCGSKNNWATDFSATVLSDNKCDAEWEEVVGDQATFGMGSHWAAGARFGAVYGVIRTRVGFTGGAEPDPTYSEPMDHTEAVNLQFDPTKVTFEKLLETFWEHHDWSLDCDTPQYMSMIYAHDEEQQRIAEQSVINMMSTQEKRVTTKVALYSVFYQAPDEYQHFLLQQQEIFKRLPVLPHQLAHSHLACRIEGYVTGFATLDLFEDELKELFLPPDVAEAIRKLCTHNQPPSVE